ncbi:hypothetical protein ACIHCQ_30440 [Streptomyces sp. NPDC052236]|uniref:hypothetical protein n=1 Tax=Streptomyces sp. NPDC052236 TaxID=3365686 RepID=UPI0037D01E70
MPDPDYFDRLLARYTPVPVTADGAVRVRPRLPGPFERVEAVRTGPPEPDEPAALVPSVSGPAFAPAAEPVRYEREVRTDRHTVVRTEAPPAGAPERSGDGAVRRTEPLPPSAAASSDVEHPAAAGRPRPARRSPAPAASDAARAVPAPAMRAAEPAPPAVAAPARPRGADAATARGAALSSVGRRAPRPAERVVHVQIGRLEVSAAPPPGAGRPAAADTAPARRAPALTLDDYLSRGEKRD